MAIDPKTGRRHHLEVEARYAAVYGDAVGSHVRDAIGRSVRLTLPMRDPVDLRRLAKILYALARQFEMYSRAPDTAGSILIAARQAVKAAHSEANDKV